MQNDVRISAVELAIILYRPVSDFEVLKKQLHWVTKIRNNTLAPTYFCNNYSVIQIQQTTMRQIFIPTFCPVPFHAGSATADSSVGNWQNNR